VTVLCLVEQADGEVADASLRALTFARTLAQSSGETLAAALFGPARSEPDDSAAGDNSAAGDRSKIDGSFVHLVSKKSPTILVQAPHCPDMASATPAWSSRPD